jgi:hypothetical protein
MSDNNELGILARRKIEAEIIKPIYEILVREIGKTRAQAVIGEAIEQAAIDAGKAFASKEPNGADVKELYRPAISVGERQRAGRQGDRRRRPAVQLQRDPLPLRRDVPRDGAGRNWSSALLRAR